MIRTSGSGAVANRSISRCTSTQASGPARAVLGNASRTASVIRRDNTDTALVLRHETPVTRAEGGDASISPGRLNHSLMQELSTSTNRFGDYILHDRIGAGGMAEIFLATATGIEGFEKRVVIKRILPSLSDDEQFVRMFIEEAKLCVALRHPNIVQVHDLGEIDAQY